MFLSPYATTACKNHVMTAIEKSVRDATKLSDGVRYLAMSDKPHQSHNVDWISRVYCVDANNKTVSFFAHPLVIQVNDGSSDDVHIVFDARPSTRLDTVENKLIPTPGFHFQKLRADIMDKLWLRGTPSDLMACGSFPHEVFVYLITNTLKTRLNLDETIAGRISCLTAYYYMCLFEENISDDKETFIKAMTKVSRIARMPLPDVLRIMGEEDGDRIRPIMNITEFCEALSTYSQSARLERLNVGMLFSMLGGVWIRPNATETVCVALEHPPTWCAMVASAVDDRSLSKTTLGDVCKMRDRISRNSSDFVVALKRAVQN